MYDFIIIGGGIVGLSTAYALVQKDPLAKVMIIEKEQQLSLHQTGRNSGVIHSGVYYKPGSLKARMAVKGRTSMVNFCRTHHVAHDVCGKVLVATDREEVARMDALYHRVQQNGVTVSKLSRDELSGFEPHVNGIAALHVPQTGIVDYKKVSEKLADLLRDSGVEFSFGSPVVNIEEGSDLVTIETEEKTFRARFFINCAGLQSDRIVKMTGIHTELQIVPFRGEYYKLTEEKSHFVNSLIYPVPNPDFPFLGVHLTKMMDGSVHAGPNAVLSLKREGYKKTDIQWRDMLEVLTFSGFWKMAGQNMKEGTKEMVRSFNKRHFLKSLQRLVPDIMEQDIVTADAGVRAQAMLRNGRLVDDFYMIPGKRSIHVCNAPSPAATASLEIGKEIAERIPERTSVIVS
ncbi:L-2-hydroxyglutarate oxidase [Halobacillus litoralis]|uniref:L-2-hydroxyglutarate oxidase n=1 Tax=Halobacillus litoralis TaxID=45668 RepID=UPI001CD5D7BB|nr:L-2-hydroxyglutarate oxidase [Halobacillus litoralis]MCA0971379.1 L-2-hydroxyglutarate oxidase [Halobacillus litoralis]